MTGILHAVEATAAERSAPRAGDAIVEPADVVMDRAFTVPRPPAEVWPWLLQLGKRRAGWYLPQSVERFLPAKRRAYRKVDEQWLGLKVGDVIPDYGGSSATFEVAELAAPSTLVYRSTRGRTGLTWSITLEPDEPSAGTRVFLRLRMAPVRHRRVARTVGELFDALTVAGMAAGLRERLAEQEQARPQP
jgi:hypothetical protein